MKQYLLSIVQPDGAPPPPHVLDPIMRNVKAFQDELKTAGAWVFSGEPSTRSSLSQLQRSRISTSALRDTS